MDKLKSWALAVAIVVLGIFSAASLSLQANLQKLLVKQPAQIGTAITQQTSNGSYTDSADFKQNAQAVFERFANGTSGQVLQADSNGKLQLVSPSALTGAFTLPSVTVSGDTRVQSFVQAGTIATFTVTSTATAANVCDNRHWIVTPVTSTPTITLPNTTTLFADCLTTNGDQITVSVETVTTSTILAAGTGGNADLSSTLTITADKSAFLRFIRNSATTYLLQVLNYNS